MAPVGCAGDADAFDTLRAEISNCGWLCVHGPGYAGHAPKRKKPRPGVSQSGASVAISAIVQLFGNSG